VVLIEHGAADATTAGRLVSADQAHLSVVIREDDILVGPLVRPGSGPCLRCLDLHRGDRDPAWPSVLAQLLSPASGTLQPEETAASMLAAGLVALQVLAHLDGVAEPATAGATLEIELPDGLIARRSWPAHPSCGCHWPPQPAGTGQDQTTGGDEPVTARDSPGSSADQRGDPSSADARFGPPTRTMEP
jgi:bacteriocin biosynthesis cyclodehydratase domain-containing protein